MQLLMTNFGDMNILAKATMAQLDAIPGIGSAIALDIWKYFHQDEPSK